MGALELAGFVSHVSLSAVCVFSAIRTLQVHRGASAGFLLHAVVSISAISCCFLPEQAMDPGSIHFTNNWVANIIGLPLLVFSFFWLSGDHLTANVVLGSALLLAFSSGHLAPESKLAALYLTNAGASLGILVVSVFIGNSYGVLGSLALGTGGLLSFVNSGKILPFSTDILSDCMYGTSFLALQMALRTQMSEVS